MDNKQRQYARLAAHLKQLRENLDETTAQVEIMANQSNMITKLGAVQASTFIGSNRVFEDEMLKK
ncbi:Hsk3 [Kluyveromyces lactis]|uniref:KLLA0E12167p n=1 Tax=Kluyveromyces lactis (strain ATCC 8585 / CBS 2359 / DSM 70799 / NBRC 1267 / NRRL Y-1140 / WM37) TaxID=284590 RepID=B4UN72_KLULA|nr:uncharacterized protein KLLA0_E12167g [Kluyveromyces lactis]QEU59357.1 Hsk3 [Kluyveromyces lactis]CAR56743.1 KLLA0E12167p [Kluyveromyces lactis]|eukprot:XP_002999405.1 uncharacterized protein KLLA0_E12167g [Kluyveromyces lactis]